MTARRPIFRDGERLTAQRLNEAFGFVDDGVRRAQLGTVGAGVSSGYQLSADDTGPSIMLRIEPGLAIDGAGRFLVTAGPQLFSINQIEDQTGPLAIGTRVLVQVHGRTPAVSATDPCATTRPQVVEERPVVGFVTAPTTGFTSSSAALAAWSDLSGAGRELAVTLGSITILSDSGGFSVSMAERQGVAPRGDAFYNSMGQRVMTMRSAAGDPEVRFLTRTSGADLTASRIGASAAASAAGFAPSDPRVLVVPRAASVAIELDPAGGPVDAAGIPIEMAGAPAGSGTVRARRAGKRPSNLALGVSAAAAYADGATTIVPLATAGLVEVRVRAGDAGIPLGALLQLAGDSELAVVAGGSAIVVARAAQESDQRGAVVTLLAWVHPAQLVALPDRTRIE